MKTATLAFLSFVMVLPAFGLVPSFPAPGTNDWATMRMAIDLDANGQGYFYVSGKLDRMEHELDRLEAGFLALSILIGSVGAGFCLLAARDAIQRKRSAAEDRPVKPCADSAPVPSRS